MANRLVDDAYKHVKTVMNHAKDELSNIQSEPIGKETRSKKDIGIIMEKMNSLPEEERNARMDEMISLSGHKGPGMDDCGMCEMIKSHAK
jgi:hypothetical protein